MESGAEGTGCEFPRDRETEARDQLAGRQLAGLWALHFHGAIFGVLPAMPKGREMPDPPRFLPWSQKDQPANGTMGDFQSQTLRRAWASAGSLHHSPGP